MAILVSPGVDVQIINESFYGSAGAGTVPLIVIATANNKASPSGAGIAPQTVSSEAGKLFLATSQRELVQSFGNPNFISAGGTSLHGHELNEYGLHAAYSYLGVSNRAYILRADIDLNQLDASDTAPRGAPISGTFWLDLAASRFGVFVANGNPKPGLAWDSRNVRIATGSNVDGVVPAAGFGANGDIAFVPADASNNKINAFFEKIGGQWLEIGETAWLAAKPSAVVHMTNDAQYPSGSVAGSIWIKLSAPNRGAEWVVKRYNGSTGQWVVIPAPFFTSDSAATQNGITGVGQVYAFFDGTDHDIELRRWDGTSFEALSYEASMSEPTTEPEDGTLWYSTNLMADVMVNRDGQEWVGLANHPDYASTDPEGVIIAGSAPEAQSDGTPLVDNDLWLNSADLENYPRMYRFDASAQRWRLIDNSDQSTPFGIVFADARLVADRNDDAVDPDAPAAVAYPDGMLLFNTRASTGNVKVFRPNWFRDGGFDPNTDYLALGDVDSAARWVTASGNRHDGSPNMLRKAQRAMVVRAMAEAVATNEDIRSEIVFFNLVAAPGYPELVDELITLNVDQKEVAFIVGDTPARLVPQGLAIQNWAMNARSAAGNGEDGLVSASPYVGVYYPWGLSTNVDGQEVMVPPSTLALRTLAYNDQVAYPWMAPAGTQRGLVSNAAAVGYLTSEGEFRAVSLNQGQRDVLYTNKINPIAFMPGSGLMVYGQKTLDPTASALDRVNVARLTNYMRYHLDKIVKPFLFQPNDGQTRDAARLTVERFLVGLVGLRAVEDFAVLCDESNNTPERRNRNELWIDVIVKPMKAVEFIYVPVRIRDSGASLEL
jgi:hypothetical protein